MGFPMLIAAIRSSGLHQWRVARLADMSASRLLRIGRHGGVCPEEREALSQLLGVPEAELFGHGPSVSLLGHDSTGYPNAENSTEERRATRTQGNY